MLLLNTLIVGILCIVGIFYLRSLSGKVSSIQDDMDYLRKYVSKIHYNVTSFAELNASSRQTECCCSNKEKAPKLIKTAKTKTENAKKTTRINKN